MRGRFVMAIDLMDRLQHDMWEKALTRCKRGVMQNDLNDWEKGFVVDMTEQYQMNGRMFEPTVRQFNLIRQLALDLDKL